jgi:hypothetical protein
MITALRGCPISGGSEIAQVLKSITRKFSMRAIGGGALD